eukprot:403346091
MGLLSRRRKVARIVKKKKISGSKKIQINQLHPTMRKHWDRKKSVQENFASMGLTYNLNPNLKYSTEGKELLKQSQVMFENMCRKNMGLEEVTEPTVISMGESKKQKNKAKKVAKAVEIEAEDSQEWEDINNYFKDDVEDQEKIKKQKKETPALNELFDDIKVNEYKQTGKKLSVDDASMMKKLIAKYGDDIKSMFRDIKLNFMQYSKGQLKEKYRLYFQHLSDKKKQ